MTIESQFKIQEINARYAEAIDNDQLEAWPDFFTDDCKYLITTADNVAQGLPIGMMYATSRAMLRDRIKALRQANVYEAQRYRHILSTPRLVSNEGGVLQARTSFMVVRIMHTGESMLFASGSYEDRVKYDSGRALFVEKSVIIDSRQIDTLLAIPL